jgi:hypothetical protein
VWNRSPEISTGPPVGSRTSIIRDPGVWPGAFSMRTLPSPKTSRSSSDASTWSCVSGPIASASTPNGVGLLRAHASSLVAIRKVALGNSGMLPV